MNLEKCLNVHFAEERGFGVFALGVEDDDKKRKQFVQLVGKVPQQRRGEFWRSLLNAVRTHLSSQEEEGKQVEAVFSLSMLAIIAWMDFNPMVSSNEDDDVMEDEEEEEENTRKRNNSHKSFTKEASPPPQSLLDLLGELHDSLFELHDFAQLQDDIAQLCERWYVENRPMRERYLPQLIPTLLILSFETNVNRVFALRHTLRLFDFSSTTSQDDDVNDAEDEDSSQLLKRMLLKCFVSPVYLKSAKGRKVLSYIMSLSREMLFACHAEMLHFQTQSLEPFAQVYFGTWLYLLKQQEEDNQDNEEEENASVVLEAFETDIVQNEFVKGAIYHRDATKRKLYVVLLKRSKH